MTLPAPAPRKRLSGLALAAAVGAAALMGSAALAPAAFAQKQQGPVVSKQVAGPLNEARAAIDAKDWAAAKAKLDDAAKHAKTPQDNFFLNQMRYFVADGTQDANGKAQAIEAMIASGQLPAAELKQYEGALAAAYLEAGNEAKAVELTKAFIDKYGGTHAQYAALANDALKANDKASAITYGEKAIEAARAEGKPPETYYRILMRAHGVGTDKYYEVEERALADYPNEGYWKELIARAQEQQGFGEALRFDLYRTLVAAGVQLNEQERSGMASEALKRALGNEAIKVLEPVEGSLSAGDKKTLQDARDMVKGEKASLAQEEKEILSSGAGADIAALGEVYLSYGDYAKAIDLIQKGLDKGVSDPLKADIARLHLGIAQSRAGQKDAALASWAQIKATPAVATLARNYTLMAQIKS